jgi:hypothetical protein
MSSSGDSCFTLCRVALCGSASAASSRTVAAVSCCRFAGNFFRLPRRRRTQQHWMLPIPVLPAHGSVRIVAELWFLSKRSLLNRCFGDLSGGRASLTLHSSLSSSKHGLAPARQPQVCLDAAGSPKTEQNLAPQPAPAAIYLNSSMSKGVPTPIEGNRFGKPGLPASIEHP